MQAIRMRSLASSLLGLVLTVILAACSDHAPESVAAAPASVTAPTAAKLANPPTAAVADASLVFSGPLVVEHQLDVLARRGGIIASLHADIGTRVSEGQVLAEIDNRQLSADLAAARAKTSASEAELKSWQSDAKVVQADYERAKKLWDAQLIPLEQFEHAKYKAEEEQFEVQRVQQSLATAKANQQSLELELDKTRICAPFSGVVARRYVREGQQVAVGDRLFWVTAEAPLRMRFTVPEKFIGQVKKGLDVPLTTPDLPDQTFKAKVFEVSPVVDAASGTFEVVVQVESSGGMLRPGMNASVSLDMLR